MGVKTEKQNIGKTGEDLAAGFLVKHGYRVVERNYLKKFGELDIICEKDNKVHFVEVKTVTRETPQTVGDYRPEDNLHARKLERMGRAIQAYIDERDVTKDVETHAVLVVLNNQGRTASVTMLKNLVI